MVDVMDYPLLVFVLSFVAMWISAWVGGRIRRRQEAEAMRDAEHEDLGVIQGAALTLLALLIGFSFSMAVGRYDQRKAYEEEEANAIGTEYLRVGLLPEADAARARQLLKAYLNQRILFYTTREPDRLEQIRLSTEQLQNDLWTAVQSPVKAQPTPFSAVVITGMNDVLNRQGYTQAAWWNRIPTAAWVLMVIIAIASNVLVGYNSRQSVGNAKVFFILPAIVAVSFFLIADMESPRRGIIRVVPQNLTSAAASMR